MQRIVAARTGRGGEAGVLPLHEHAKPKEASILLDTLFIARMTLEGAHLER